MLNFVSLLINSLLGIYISTPKVLLPNSIAQFNLKVYKCDDVYNNENYNSINNWNAIVLYSKVKENMMPLRVHDQCMTSEIFGSLRCDCQEQLEESMKLIKDTGMIIYLPNEGRGIGLFNKMLTYKLQEEGEDTFTSAAKLNLPIENRDYSIVPKILKDFDIKSINLITNNKHKIKQLEKKYITIKSIIPLNSTINPHNEKYLNTKYNYPYEI